VDLNGSVAAGPFVVLNTDALLVAESRDPSTGSATNSW
jgi:hypothetical protein